MDARRSDGSVRALGETQLLEGLHLTGDGRGVEPERAREGPEPLRPLVGELGHDAVGGALEVDLAVAWWRGGCAAPGAAGRSSAARSACSPCPCRLPSVRDPRSCWMQCRGERRPGNRSDTAGTRAGGVLVARRPAPREVRRPTPHPSGRPPAGPAARAGAAARRDRDGRQRPLGQAAGAAAHGRPRAGRALALRRRRGRHRDRREGDLGLRLLDRELDAARPTRCGS